VSHRPHIAPEKRNRRALILPGGGMRVAYQAGAIQRLHEEGLRFSHGDGTSGGLMNLGALMSGVAPEDLAKRWRTLRATGFISPLSLKGYLRFPNLAAFGDFDGITHYIYPHLGIDADRITRAEGVSGRFNVCDFARKAVVSVPHTEITEAQLLAGMSLPMFTPAVPAKGTIWTDAVWIKDSNLLQAVQDGANELWVIWCIGNTPEWRMGTLNQYVHMIEMAAVGALNAEMAEIARLNTRIAAGEKPHGHTKPIRVHLIRPDLPIPLDPAYVAGKVSGNALVDQGYADASAYLARMKPDGVPLDGTATRTPAPAPGVTFRETMKGRIAFGTDDPRAGWADRNAIPLVLNATINIRDIKGFVTDPQHRADMAAHIYSPRLGFIRPSTHANFQLFAPTEDPTLTHMTYETGLMLEGQQHFLSGRKHVRRGPPWRMWGETTTLYVRLHKGRDTSGKVVAAGILRLGLVDFLGLMATLSARDSGGFWRGAKSIAAFIGFFAGTLIDTYLSFGRRK
jgi:predicted patatin/cPLA2 family phospholipase